MILLKNGLRRLSASAILLLLAAPGVLRAQTQAVPAQGAPVQMDPPLKKTLRPRVTAAQPAAAKPAVASEPDRSSSYYHYGLAHLYEEMAVNDGRSDYATQAIEEYKLALNADPNSPLLQDGLADLYFRLGRIQDAVNAAKDQVKLNPNDIDAHTLLGQVYVRSLSDAPVTVTGVDVGREGDGVSFISLGFPGATVQLLQRLTTENLADDLRRMAPDMVVLAFGTNEGFNDNLDVATYIAQYEQIVRRLQSLRPGLKIVMVGPADAARSPRRGSRARST